MINNVYQCQYCDRNVLMSNKEKHLKECKGKTYLSNYIDKNDDQKENIEISQELSSNKNKDNLPPSYNNHEDTKFAMKIQYEEYNQRIDNQNNDSELARNLQILEFNRHPNNIRIIKFFPISIMIYQIKIKKQRKEFNIFLNFHCFYHHT